jgi:hypothetical protein
MDRNRSVKPSDSRLPAFDAVQLACDREVERLLKDFADEISALPAEEQTKIDDVRRRGPEPAEESLKVQENLLVRKESPMCGRLPTAPRISPPATESPRLGHPASAPPMDRDSGIVRRRAGERTL